jgi:tetratricopeptide (TPR) repeat protein
MYRLNLTLVLLFLAVQYSLNLSAYCISETFSYNSNRQDSIRAELLVDSALFFWRKGHLRKALFHYKNSLDLFKNANSWNNYIRASNRVGRLYYHLSYLEKAEFHLKESLSINVNLSSPKLESFAKSHFWLGLVNYEKGDYFSADSLLNVCLETQLKFYSEESTELGLTYLNIADINSDLGFYEKAIQNYNAAIDIFNNNNETYLLKSAISNKLTIFAQKEKINEYISESLKLVNYKNLQDVDYNIIMNIANIYNKYENIEEAIAILNSFLNKREFGNLDDYIKAEFYSLLGFSLAQNQNFIYAHHYLKKGLNIYLKAYGENSLHVANEYSQLGFLFFKKKNYHKSLRYYNKAINIYNKISSNHKSLAAIFFRKSLAILEIGDIPIARNILLKSLEMTSHFYSESSYKILEIKNNLCKADLIIGNYEKAIESIDSTFSYFFNSKESLEENKLIFLSMPQIYELLNSLIIKIDLLNALILSTNNSKLIKEKTNTYINISIIVNYLRKNYSSLNKKITFTSQKYNLFTGGLNSAIATSKITDPIFYKKLAYKFNGMNKAGILLESLNHSQARNFASLPDSLRDKERDLKIDITFYNNKLNEENSKQTPRQRQGHLLRECPLRFQPGLRSPHRYPREQVSRLLRPQTPQLCGLGR